MADDRKCDLGVACVCSGLVDRKHERMGRDNCPHFHMPCPAIVQSKQDRLRVTRSAWDKRRDKMMREAEKRFDKLKPQAETEEKLRDIRHNPMKHLQRKGVKSLRKPV